MLKMSKISELKRRPKLKKLDTDFVCPDSIKEKIRKSQRNLNEKTEDFVCELCGTTKFTKNTKFSTKKCRIVYDSKSQKSLKACNACGLKYRRSQSRIKSKPNINEFESDSTAASSSGKFEYIKEAEIFALKITELVKVEEDKRKIFYCPKFKRGKSCKCLQTFLQFGE